MLGHLWEAADSFVVQMKYKPHSSPRREKSPSDPKDCAAFLGPLN